MQYARALETLADLLPGGVEMNSDIVSDAFC